MAYTWTDGELITAEKLNNTGGVLVVNTSIENGEAGDIITLDKTWIEIRDALANGIPVFVKKEYNENNISYNLINGVGYNTGDNKPYGCYADDTEYFSENADGYPDNVSGGNSPK